AGQKDIDARADPSGALLPRCSFEAWTQHVDLTSRSFSAEDKLVANSVKTVLAHSIANRSQPDLEHSLQMLRDRNAHMEAFVYGVSHDLRAPLVSLDGFLHHAQRAVGGVQTHQLKHYLGLIQTSSDQMRVTLEKLFETIKTSRESPRIETTALRPIIEQCITRAMYAPSKGEDFEVRLEGSFGEVAIPEVHIQQIFDNLLSNAIKYGLTASDRTIVIEGTTEPHLTVVVRDRGPGIPLKYVDKAFQRFSRVHGGEQPGYGVGLSIVKQLITDYNGDIQLEASDRGAAFRLRFPHE
ncbi:MAG: HAMP domain-containing sensor histidine kinase, partial [Myxococcota bacterium]